MADAHNTDGDFISDHESVEIVVWSEKYNTGIELIDKQHKELVSLINTLHRACCRGKALDAAFKESMSRMVEYVHFHFGVEQQFLKRIKYDGYKNHVREHTVLVNNILAAAKNFEEGRKFVPHTFVRTLKDWLLGHIAVSDKHYAAYVMEQKKKGVDFCILEEKKLD